MLDPDLVAEYNATRDTVHTELLCHAPSASLNFEANGHATACCYNRRHVIGTYPEDTLEEM